MISNIKLIDYLREIEEITDINGCFFINVEDNILIESTIPFKIYEEILWELCVLRDTFQQFSNEFNHDQLNELVIEGDRGYILLYNIPPHLILVAVGSLDMNLSYLKLAMIDIMRNLRKKVLEFGDELLKIPAKDLGILGRITELAAAPGTTETIKPERVKMQVIKPKRAKIQPVTTEPVTTEPVASRVEEELDIVEMINSIKNKAGKEKYISLKNIFDRFKVEIKSLTGVKFSELLNLLKDAILENLGTSLALFDISKSARDLSKIHQVLSPESIKMYQDRIDNWSLRIVKL